jgi:hypothetical protein
MNLLGALRPTAVPPDLLDTATTLVASRIQQQAAIKAVNVETQMARTVLQVLDPQLGSKLDRRS